MKRLLWMPVAFCMTASVMGTAAAETVLTAHFAWPGAAASHRAVADAFEKANPGIRIEFDNPSADYEASSQDIIRRSISGDLPDVYFPGFNKLADVANRDIAVPLDGFLEAEGDPAALGYSESLLSLGRIDNTQYGLAFTASTPIIYFNADLVRAAGGDPAAMPSTWDGLVDLAGDITALEDGTDGISYNPGSDDWLFQALVFSFGGEMMSADGKEVAFDGPAGQKAMKLFRRFHDEGGQKAISFGDAVKQFVAGKLGMIVTSPSDLKYFETEVGDKFALGTARLPVVSEASRVAGLSSFFDHRIFTPGAQIAPKPAPDVYLSAARFMGTPPDRCLAVEDSVAGVKAAVAAGMNVVGFAGGLIESLRATDLEEAGASIVMGDMSGLRTLLIDCQLIGGATGPY